MFGKKKSAQIDEAELRKEIEVALQENSAQLEKDAGKLGRVFIGAVDKAVRLQTSVIRGYVDWLRRDNPDKSPAQIQAIMDKHLKNTVTGTGAGVGAAAAVPGVGLFTGAAAVAGESALFLDLAAFYAMSSAYLRGDDISDPEHRRAIVLTTLMGTKGLAIVDTLLGENSRKLPGKATLSRFSGPTLNETNNVLQRMAMRSLRRSMRRAWLGKMLPLGLGAIAGTTVNRKLAGNIIDNIQQALGPVPLQFATPLEPEDTADETGRIKGGFNPKEFAAWILKIFRDGKDSSGKDSNDKEHEDH